jgi:hypothetical protein
VKTLRHELAHRNIHHVTIELEEAAAASDEASGLC